MEIPCNPHHIVFLLLNPVENFTDKSERLYDEAVGYKKSQYYSSAAINVKTVSTARKTL